MSAQSTSKKVFLSMFLVLGTSVAFAATTETSKTTSQKVGEFSQEHSAQTKTADSQMKGTTADVEVTRRIRDRLTDDKSLSVEAQNITIVTLNNAVTLKGEVPSQAEVTKIKKIAKDVAGAKVINSQLKVEQ